MSLQIDDVSKVCNFIQRQVKETFKNLTIHYIIHHDGQKLEALGLARQSFLNHPAAETGLHILSKTTPSEQSSLIGIAVAQENVLMGLASRDSFLAMASINIDQYQTLNDVRRHAYHIAWHAIDGTKYHNEVAKKKKSVRDIIIRRRNALELTGANLRADVFASMVSSLQGSHKSIKSTANRRGTNTLLAQSDHNPEHYPFIAAMESTSLILKQIRKKTIHKKKQIETALKAADNIGNTFDKASLEHWLSFSNPAQDMAWRGFSSEDILSAAINTSEDTYVRATGYLVAEITGLEPSALLDIRENYSPFADDSFNEKLHEKAVNDVFEDVIAEGLKDNNAAAFIAIAQKQNKSLTDGNALGWCAAALQASGRAFEVAILNGEEPTAAARKEFATEHTKTTWDTLKTLSKAIIDKHRQGESVSLHDVLQLCKNDRGAQAIRRAVDLSIKIPGLEQAPRASTPTPRSPAPAMQQKLAPATPVAGPAAPMPPGVVQDPFGAAQPPQAQSQQQSATPRTAKNTDNQDTTTDSG